MARRSDSDRFLAALESCGGRASNGALRSKLGWDDEKYWRKHTQLHDEGFIEKGRGYGGIVIRIGQAPPEVPNAEVVASLSPSEADSDAEDIGRELDLYEPVRKELQAHWAQQRLLDACHCEVTALQGRRDTGGSWTRPDLALIGYKKYEFLPEKVFELVTFEVKPVTDISIKGVMEALAHREAATRSIVIYHTAGAEFGSFAEATRIQDLATKHGVGVYAARRADTFDQWIEVIPAQRASPDPEAVDAFIRRTMSDATKTLLRKWF